MLRFRVLGKPYHHDTQGKRLSFGFRILIFDII